MSPRSEELVLAAREWLAAARSTLGSGFGPSVITVAYYAMLYAARAALSEEDLYAKTHSGTWNLFHETFVATGRFDRALFAQAHETLPLRIAADYEAQGVELKAAEEIVALAARFVAAVEVLYPD